MGHTRNEGLIAILNRRLDYSFKGGFYFVRWYRQLFRAVTRETALVLSKFYFRCHFNLFSIFDMEIISP